LVTKCLDVLMSESEVFQRNGRGFGPWRRT